MSMASGEGQNVSHTEFTELEFSVLTRSIKELARMTTSPVKYNLTRVLISVPAALKGTVYHRPKYSDFLSKCNLVRICFMICSILCILSIPLWEGKSGGQYLVPNSS